MAGSDESAQDGIGLSVISPAQARAARALLGWSKAEVAGKLGVSEETIHDFEAGYGDMPSGQVEALKSALTTAGVLFSNGSEPGVSLSRRGRDEGTRADDLTTENDR